MEYNHVRQHSPSFRSRIKSSIFCFTYHVEPAAPSSSGSDDDEFRRPRLVSKSSPSSWIRSRAHDLPEEIKDKCASLFSKIGGRGFRRQRDTSEYRYDPMSYALNFDDEAARIDEFPLRNFTSRLPLSPPPQNTFPAVIVACF